MTWRDRIQQAHCEVEAQADRAWLVRRKKVPDGAAANLGTLWWLDVRQRHWDFEAREVLIRIGQRYSGFGGT